MGFELQAVIFDFNGVIVDDEPLHLELFRRVLQEEGLQLTDEDYHKKYLGYDDRGCFMAALKDYGKPRIAADKSFIDELIERKAKYYMETIDQRLTLFPGVVELIRRLEDRYPMAVTSGALRREIEFVLERGKIRPAFQFIIAAEDVTACKPDPEGYIKALSLINSLTDGNKIRPDECLVIEDSVSGVEAAKRSGMKCLAVTNSYSAEDLQRADWIVENLIDCDPEGLMDSLQS